MAWRPGVRTILAATGRLGPVTRLVPWARSHDRAYVLTGTWLRPADSDYSRLRVACR